MALDPNAFTRSLLAIKGSGVKPDYSAFDAEQEARKAEGNALAKRVWNDEIKRRMGNDFTNPDNLQSVMRFDPEAGAKLIKSANDLRTGVRDQTKFEDTRRNAARREFMESLAGLARDGSDENLARFAASAKAAGLGAEAQTELARLGPMDKQSREAYLASQKEVREGLAIFNSNPTVIGSAETGMGYIERNPLSPNYNGGIPRAIGNAPQAAAPMQAGLPSNPRSPEVGSVIEQQALSIIPGMVVSSRQRSPERNAAVGGVADSYHVSGAARDFVPPAGVSMQQAAAMLKQSLGPMYDVVNEGDHIHVEPSPNFGIQRVANPMFSAPKAPPPPKPAAQWVDATVNGVPGQRNSATGQFKPLPEYAVKAGGNAAGARKYSVEDLPSAQQELWKATQELAQSTRDQDADLQRFREVNKGKRTGGMFKVPLIEGVYSALDADYNEMNTLNSRLTPKERQAGSGAMSDKDMANYRRSVPGAGNFGDVNTNLITRRLAGNEAIRDYAEFTDWYVAQNGKLDGMQEQWNQYSNANPIYQADGLPVKGRKKWRAYFEGQAAGNRVNSLVDKWDPK